MSRSRSRHAWRRRAGAVSDGIAQIGRPAAYLVAVLAAALTGASAQAAWEPRLLAIGEGVYAIIGETGPRTAENFGLNANLGFIVTGHGVVLVDSGALARFGPVIEALVARVTAEPIRWAVNLGTQDHRWLGNAWFQLYGFSVTGQSCVSILGPHSIAVGRRPSVTV